jgi:hypothetical protein
MTTSYENHNLCTDSNCTNDSESPE